MPGRAGLELVDEVRKRRLDTTVVVMTAYGSKEVAIEAMKRGAYDYLSKPFESDELVLLLRKAEERERLFRENQTLRRAAVAPAGTRSRPASATWWPRARRMTELFRTIRKIAEFKTTVLVGGESGTGKELVARALHRLLARAATRPSSPSTAAPFPRPLLESELFGHRKGAFTDANRDRARPVRGGQRRHPVPRRDRRAAAGAAGQAAARAAGGGDPAAGRHPGRARSTCGWWRPRRATWQPRSQRGTFREDLYYRLNVVRLQLPPLRERREDIPLLVAHFVERMNARMGLAIAGRHARGHAPADRARLAGQRARAGEHHRAGHGADRERRRSTSTACPTACAAPAADATAVEHGRAAPSDDGDLSIKRASRRAEEELIRRALAKTGGNRTRAAELLEISHRALLYKIKEYGIASSPRRDADAPTRRATCCPQPRRPGGSM